MGQPRRSVIEVLDDLEQSVLSADDPHSIALFALGCMLSIAIKAGVTCTQMAALHALQDVTLEAARKLAER